MKISDIIQKLTEVLEYLNDLQWNEFVVNNGLLPDILLESAQFLDGSPCGVLVEGVEERQKMS